jgi:hypothetical protein
METTHASFSHFLWENPMGEARKDALRLSCEARMTCGTGENRAGGMEGNGGSVPTQWEKVDSSRKYVAFLLCNAA